MKYFFQGIWFVITLPFRIVFWIIGKVRLFFFMMWFRREARELAILTEEAERIRKSLFD